MNELEIKADEIRLKVARLLRNYHELSKQRDLLEKENAELKNVIENQKNTINKLEETNKIVKIAEALQISKNDIHGLKKKVNEYIREIDECIRLLSDR